MDGVQVRSNDEILGILSNSLIAEIVQWTLRSVAHCSVSPHGHNFPQIKNKC